MGVETLAQIIAGLALAKQGIDKLVPSQPVPIEPRAGRRVVIPSEILSAARASRDPIGYLGQYLNGAVLGSGLGRDPDDPWTSGGPGASRFPGYAATAPPLDEARVRHVVEKMRQPAHADGTPRRLPKIRFSYVRSLAEKAELIKQIGIADASTAETIAEARLIVGQKQWTGPNSARWEVAERDYEKELDKFFSAVRDVASPHALRYLADPVHMDTLATSKAMREVNSEDCDGGTVRLLSWGLAAGFSMLLRIIAAADEAQVKSEGPPDFNHIYPMAGLPKPSPTRWKALDWSATGKPIGWQAPGTEECARTGQPHGWVWKVYDVPVFVI